MNAPLDVTEILRRLPHRYPFLMIDRIDEYTAGHSLVARKNVTVNEPYFTGHFPETPIMPGVMLIESMAQAGGFLFEIGDRLCVLAGVDAVRFRGVVVPGDRVDLHAEALAALSSMGKVHVDALVEGRTVATADLTYSFVEGIQK